MDIAFVCLGNICRSPMAELIFNKIAAERGFDGELRAISFGTSDCEEGNPIYPPALKTLKSHGVEGSHRARQLTLADVKNCGYILVMDSGNLFDVLRLTGGGYSEKIFKLCDFCDRPRDVDDPWYTRDFERAYFDIVDGIEGFLRFLGKGA